MGELLDRDLPVGIWGRAMDISEVARLVATVPHWHHRFEITPGFFTPGSYDPAPLFNHLELPLDLSECRLLDIGPSDGFFSMHAAKRGAAVTAVDYRAKDSHGFDVMERVSGLRFRYLQRNVYELDAAELGTFDIVLFLGVLYHLPDMIRALDIVRTLCNDRMFLETHFEPDLHPGVALARYYEAATLAGDYTNFWSPNADCVLAMLRDASFRPVRQLPWVPRGRLLVEAERSGTGRTEKMRAAYGLLT